ncbi:SDR family NAD(P)-dependent oxidoreductase, partial [Saccharomonospora iraqiensis]|uniref:SDR family NAD(P)-dependent oxidoreductase n=1 Tax=Saccharomonospora iraqiensis TaxID=52698 RepID=UPI00022E0466
DRALAVAADVTDRAGMAAAVAEVLDRAGRVDIAVANAGVSPEPATVRTMDPAEYDRVVAINQTGVFNTVRAVADAVIATGGHVVTVSSAAAFAPGPGGSPYMMSKAAVEQLGRALRPELAAHGVTVGVAYFGVVRTSMTTGVLDDHPLGRRLDRMLPRPLRHRVSAEHAATVVAD